MVGGTVVLVLVLVLLTREPICRWEFISLVLKSLPTDTTPPGYWHDYRSPLQLCRIQLLLLRLLLGNRVATKVGPGSMAQALLLVKACLN